MRPAANMPPARRGSWPNIPPLVPLAASAGPQMASTRPAPRPFLAFSGIFGPTRGPDDV
jgi:hypothetical protein